MPLPSEQHQNTTSEYTPCKTDTHRGMIKHMLGCLGKAPPDRSLFNMSDYIIQQLNEAADQYDQTWSINHTVYHSSGH